ncbi:MAG: NADH:flavin oxidoreductase/NADH oxidase family protein [Nevskia sp.]|nr:NADH:flavin oxidoreductase/NADH oxidase family protein [Nevskia sp.]
MTDLLAQPLKLPCGATLSNRLGKAPLTEGLADPHNRATDKLVRLYRLWSEGGAGLLVSGNVQVDRRYLERAGNVAIDNNGGLDMVRAYAKAGTSGGNHFWMQINHPGRQAGVTRDGTLVAPSAVKLHLAGKETITPRALTEGEILDIIRRFAHVATMARECGFTGVQIHAAHGYLFSQFLSGLTNQRTDAWGGSLANRARALLETLRAVRKAVGNDFPISMKLNSADFQKGGFSNDECLEVVRWLGQEKLDLLEISGGTYEQASMIGAAADTAYAPKMKASTLAREGYFIEYAKRMREVTTMPLMITGGLRSRAAMEEALASGGMDVIGLGRPMCVDTDICKKLLTRQVDVARSYEKEFRFDPKVLGPDAPADVIKAVEMWGGIGWFYVQLWRIGEGQEPDRNLSLFDAFQSWQAGEAKMGEALAPL